MRSKVQKVTEGGIQGTGTKTILGAELSEVEVVM